MTAMITKRGFGHFWKNGHRYSKVSENVDVVGAKDVGTSCVAGIKI